MGPAVTRDPDIRKQHDLGTPDACRVRGIGTGSMTTGRHGLRTGAGGERYF